MPRQKLCRAEILDLIERDGPVSAADMIERLAKPYNTVWSAVKKMRLASELHVVDWQRVEGSSGPPRAVFASGAGKDAPKPKKLPKTEVSKRYRAKWMAKLKLTQLARKGRPSPGWLNGLI